MWQKRGNKRSSVCTFCMRFSLFLIEKTRNDGDSSFSLSAIVVRNRMIIVMRFFCCRYVDILRSTQFTGVE